MPYHYKKTIKKSSRVIDTIVSVIAIISPAMTLPQVILLFTSKNAAGISALTWSAYVLTSALWLLYGFQHKESPIIINSVIGGFLSLLVVLGALMFG